MSFELIGASCERRGHLGGAVAALLAHSQAAALFSYNQQKMLIHQSAGKESRQSRMTYCSEVDETLKRSKLNKVWHRGIHLIQNSLFQRRLDPLQSRDTPGLSRLPHNRLTFSYIGLFLFPFCLM